MDVFGISNSPHLVVEFELNQNSRMICEDDSDCSTTSLLLSISENDEGESDAPCGSKKEMVLFRRIEVYVVIWNDNNSWLAIILPQTFFCYFALPGFILFFLFVNQIDRRQLREISDNPNIKADLEIHQPNIFKVM